MSFVDGTAAGYQSAEVGSYVVEQSTAEIGSVAPVYLGSGTEVNNGGDNSVTIGDGASTLGGLNSTAVGQGAEATGNDACAYGSISEAAAAGSIAVGRQAVIAAACANAVVIGNGSGASANSEQIVIGSGATSAFSNTLQLGQGSLVLGTEGQAIGHIASAVADSTAIGWGVVNSVTETVALGADSTILAHFSKHGSGTEAANAVTVNATKGKITLSGVLGAGASQRITLTNSFISANSVVHATVNAITDTADATEKAVTASIGAPGAGSITIHVHNPDALATNAAPVIHFSLH